MELLIVLGVVAFFCIASDGDTFVYKEKYGGWRTYFKKEPKNAAHVLRDSDGCYVCWNRPLATKEDVKKIAKLWLPLQKNLWASAGTGRLPIW